jgi:hypothetical protein
MIEIALLAQLAVWLTVVVVLFASRQASLLHPATIYAAFHGLVFVVRPLLVYYLGFDTNWNYMLFNPTEEMFERTLAVTSLGLICFMTACLLMGKGAAVGTRALKPQFSKQERAALLITTGLLAPLAAYSIWTTREGIAGERIGGIYVMTDSTGYINEAQHFLMPLLCAWLVLTRFRAWNLLPISAYVGYRAWFGWSRWTILLFLVMVVLAYCWYHGRKWLPAWSLAAAVPILVIFNLLGHNRELIKSLFSGGETQAAQSRPGAPESERLKQQLDTQDFSNFDFLTYVVAVVPERTGRYTYGLQYLQLFTEPIPRILWKGKPVGAPVRTVDIGAYGNFVGLTVSLCGDGWLSGGWAGVIIMLLLVGGMLGRAYRWFCEHSANRLGAMVYIVALSMVPQWYRDGGISIFKFLLFTLSPLFVWMGVTWLIGSRSVPLYSVVLPRRGRVSIVHPGISARPGEVIGNG